MKGTLPVIIRLLLHSFTHAQTAPKRIMVRAGLGYSNFLIPAQPQIENFGGQWGSHFGLSYSMPLAKQFAWTAELQWSQKGAQVKYNNILATIDLAYGSAPLSIAYLHKKWQFAIGLEPSLRLYTRIGGPYLTDRVSDILARSIRRRLEINQFVQVEYRIKRFGFSNRIGIGLSNLSTVGSETDPQQQNPNFQMGRNLYYQCTIGYTFY